MNLKENKDIEGYGGRKGKEKEIILQSQKQEKYYKSSFSM